VLVGQIAERLRGRGQDFEIILVDDYSKDESWKVIQQLVVQDSCVRGIGLMRNFGQHNALLCGIRQARYAVTVTMDDDLQHPPEEMAKLLDRLAVGDVDVVYGSPEHLQHGVLRDLASLITKLAMQRVMGASTAQSISAFRAFRTSLRQAFAEYKDAYVSIDVLLTWATNRFVALTVRHDARYAGQSNYTVTKLMTHALNMITGFSIWPLQLASAVGFIFVLFGGGVLAYVLTRYLIHGQVVPGFAFLASIIAIFSGAQLFTLGVMGEYLARMHFRSMQKPAYVVGRTTDGSPTLRMNS